MRVLTNYLQRSHVQIRSHSEVLGGQELGGKHYSAYYMREDSVKVKTEKACETVIHIMKKNKAEEGLGSADFEAGEIAV